MDLKDLGPRFNALLRMRGASAEAVGQRADVSRAQVDHIRTGRRLPTLGTLQAMLDYLEADLIVTWRLRESKEEEVSLPTSLAVAARSLVDLPADEQRVVAELLRLYLEGSPQVRGLLRGMVRGVDSPADATKARSTG